MEKQKRFIIETITGMTVEDWQKNNALLERLINKDTILVSQEKLWIELQDCGVSKSVFDTIIETAKI